MLPKKTEKENISLDSAVRHILEECRMVLPGIQALFGFQLIAVFNPTFSEKLSHFDQDLHLLSIILIVIAVALVISPAAIHRQAEPMAVSLRFIKMASGLLLWSMLSLALGICLECYLVAKVILYRTDAALMVAVALFVLFITLWMVLPRLERVAEKD